MSRALTDPNRRTTLIAKDDTDPTKIVEVTADPLTGALNANTVASVGTQYDSGDPTPATPTGTILVFDDAGTITHVSDTNPLPVEVTTNAAGLATEAKQDSIISAIGSIQDDALTDTQLRATPVPVSGTVTANAGTNLDTSALALENGGNLATIAGAITDSKMQVDVVGALPSGGNTIGNVTAQITSALPAGTNIIGALSANQSVNVAQMNGASVAMGDGASGTGVQRVTIASDSTGQVKAIGAAAHNASVSGNPVLIAGEGRTSDQSAVTSGRATRLLATVTGKQVVLPYAIPELSLSGTASATGTSNTAIISAQGSGVRIYVTSIVISNSSNTDTEVEIKSATTTLMTYPAPAKSGAVHALPTPLQLTANQALNFASLAAVTTMKVSAVGYRGA